MDSVKTWLVEVVIKKVAPTAVASLMASGVAFMLVHQQLMEQMGITYYPNFNGTWSGGVMPTGELITVELSTLKYWGAALLVTGFTGLMMFVMHHGKATVTGAPQSGDLRKTPDVPLSGGNRAGDSPAGGQS